MALIWSFSSRERGVTGISRSMYTRNPRWEGIRPEEVCGCSISPMSKRAAMSLRMVAGETRPPSCWATHLDPTGSPVRI